MEDLINKNNEKYVPLKFWFIKSAGSAFGSVFDEEYNELCEKVKDGMEKLDSMNYEEVIEFEKTINIYIEKHAIRYGFVDVCGGVHSYLTKPVFMRKKELSESNIYAKKYYETKLIMKYAEEINGYKLYDTDSYIMDFELFEKLRQLLKSNEPMLKEEFETKFENIACSDWCKMDRYGECYGGFWKYPEDTEERKDAYNLSRKDNYNGLWLLPYPKKMILKTIEIGCKNRMESVRYSNFLCEWVTRVAKSVY